MLEDIDLSTIQDESARQLISQLLNLIEVVTSDLRDAQAENQRLRDEISRLKGEQGKPKIKANMPKPPRVDYSSEKERRKPKAHQKRAKKATLVIHREQTLEVDKASLPADAEFKGCEDVVVQDLVFRADNVCFHKEKYWAESTGQSYLAPLPLGYEGQFGPGIKALSLTLYFGGKMSEPEILGLYKNIGVQISAGQLSNLLIKKQEGFHLRSRLAQQPLAAHRSNQHASERPEPALQHRVQSAVHRLYHHAEQGPLERAGRAAQWASPSLPAERGSVGLPGVYTSVESPAPLVVG